MPNRLKKTIFMLRKFLKDIGRAEKIYDVSEDLNSPRLGEYYFIMDEEKLRSGYSQSFQFDEQGIPLIPTYIDVAERKLIYYPISIGQFGLAIFHSYLKTNSPNDRNRFLKIVDWFYDTRISDERMGDYWLTDVPKPEYRIHKAWPSAFAQSRGISILLRGHQLTDDEKYLDAATKALKIYEIPAAKNGVTTFTEYGPVYEEYPAPFPTLVLDGSIFSLFGLYDYIRAGPNTDMAQRLFDEGIQALTGILPQYDLGFWIRYNLCDQAFYPKMDPATVSYFRLVIGQLELLHKLSGKSEFLQIGKKWKEYDRFFNILRMYGLKYKALRQLNRL